MHACVITYVCMSVREWDGACYDRISGPMEALGRAVLDRMELRGDETVLDAGCGSGRVTEALLARLPRGRVIAVDVSPSMVRVARERFGQSREIVEPAAGDVAAAGGGRVEVREGDLLELELDQPVDAVLSTATFHWIAGHDLLFARLHAALRPGGQLVAQCGGKGNIDILRGVANGVLARDPYAEHFVGWRAPWNYAGPERTRERLLDAGFASAECWLTPAPRQPEHPREFLATIVLGPHVQRLPEGLRDPFLDAVLAALGEPVTVDYVRLNIDAVA
jgi:trans-aconitate 2-methyltransferase